MPEDYSDRSSCRYATFDRWRVTKWAASGGSALAVVVTVVLYVNAVANTRAMVMDLRRMQYDRITGIGTAIRTELMRRGLSRLSAQEREGYRERHEESIREQNRRTQERINAEYPMPIVPGFGFQHEMARMWPLPVAIFLGVVVIGLILDYMRAVQYKYTYLRKGPDA